MHYLRSFSVFLLALALLPAVKTFASPMTFQVTGGDPPGFQQTLTYSDPPYAGFVYTLIGINVLPSSDAIDLSAGGSVLLGSTVVGSGHISSEEDWVAKGSFSIEGLLKTSSTDPGIQITMSGNVTGSFSELQGFQSTWVGGFSGTVNSVTFPTGTPASETQSLLNALGDLSRFHIDGGVSTGGVLLNDPGQIPSYTLSMSFNLDPNENPVPEPGSFVVFALLATGYGVFHAARSRKPA